MLKARSLGSLGVGAPIYYRSLPVGEVAAYSLAADGKSIEVTVFVDAPYDKYVTSETRFWNASGIDVSVGADGVDIRTESIVSVLVGGIAIRHAGLRSARRAGARRGGIYALSEPRRWR